MQVCCSILSVGKPLKKCQVDARQRRDIFGEAPSGWRSDVVRDNFLPVMSMRASDETSLLQKKSNKWQFVLDDVLFNFFPSIFCGIERVMLYVK